MKHLRINLQKDVQDLYSENYEAFVREIKDDLNKKRDRFCVC